MRCKANSARIPHDRPEEGQALGEPPIIGQGRQPHGSAVGAEPSVSSAWREPPVRPGPLGRARPANGADDLHASYPAAQICNTNITKCISILAGDALA